MDGEMDIINSLGSNPILFPFFFHLITLRNHFKIKWMICRYPFFFTDPFIFFLNYSLVEISLTFFILIFLIYGQKYLDK